MVRSGPTLNATDRMLLASEVSVLVFSASACAMRKYVPGAVSPGIVTFNDVAAEAPAPSVPTALDPTTGSDASMPVFAER